MLYKLYNYVHKYFPCDLHSTSMFFVCRNRSKDQMGARKMVDESVSVAIELRTNPTKPKLKKLKRCWQNN